MPPASNKTHKNAKRSFHHQFQLVASAAKEQLDSPRLSRMNSPRGSGLHEERPSAKKQRKSKDKSEIAATQATLLASDALALLQHVPTDTNPPQADQDPLHASAQFPLEPSPDPLPPRASHLLTLPQHVNQSDSVPLSISIQSSASSSHDSSDCEIVSPDSVRRPPDENAKMPAGRRQTKRRCSSCNIVGHDARTCPKKKTRPPVPINVDDDDDDDAADIGDDDNHKGNPRKQSNYTISSAVMTAFGPPSINPQDKRIYRTCRICARSYVYDNKDPNNYSNFCRHLKKQCPTIRDEVKVVWERVCSEEQRYKQLTHIIEMKVKDADAANQEILVAKVRQKNITDYTINTTDDLDNCSLSNHEFHTLRALFHILENHPISSLGSPYSSRLFSLLRTPRGDKIDVPCPETYRMIFVPQAIAVTKSFMMSINETAWKNAKFISLASDGWY